MAHSTARRRAVNRRLTPARRLACPHRITYFEQLYDDIHKQDGAGHYAGFPDYAAPNIGSSQIAHQRRGIVGIIRTMPGRLSNASPGRMSAGRRAHGLGFSTSPPAMRLISLDHRQRKPRA